MSILKASGEKVKKRKQIIYSNKKHSKTGIFSFILGVIVMLSLVISVVLSYKLKGAAPANFGAVGFLCTLFSSVGIILSVVARNKPDCIHLYANIGLALNIVDLLFISNILYAGI